VRLARETALRLAGAPSKEKLEVLLRDVRRIRLIAGMNRIDDPRLEEAERALAAGDPGTAAAALEK
jgi:hypothetical protein